MSNIITKLRKLKIRLILINGELRINAPEGVLTEDIVEEIRKKKDFLKQYLTTVHSGNNYQSLVKFAQKEGYKLSSSQKRLYFLYEMDSSSLAYNMPYALKLDGQLDKEKLVKVFEKLISRHESLRTSFELFNHEPLQKVIGNISFVIENLQPGETSLMSSVNAFIRPFNLKKAPLLRVGLLKINPIENILIIDMHHIISDGVSQAILKKEFMQLYKGEDLPALPLQYKDYAEWQQSSVQHGLIERQKGFWMNQFADEPKILELPADFTRPSIKEYDGDVIGFSLSEIETIGLGSLARDEGATMFMVLLSIFNILLSKLSGQEDIIIGTPTAGRLHADLESIIGMFVNTLPIRNHPMGHLSFRKFLGNVRENTLACLQNQSYPYEELIDELKIERDTSRNSLFDVMFTYQNAEEQEWNMAGLTMKTANVNHTVAMFDLTLTASEKNGRVYMELEFYSKFFLKERVVKFATYFKKIIAAIIEDPYKRISEIDILSENERHQLVHVFNNTRVQFDSGVTIIDQFEYQVDKMPLQIAVVMDEKNISYGDLDAVSNQLAHLLKNDIGVSSNDLVIIYMEKSVEVIKAVLGVWKAGAAYVPVVSRIPEGRFIYMIRDIRPKLIITQLSLLNKAKEILKKAGAMAACFVFRITEQDEKEISPLPFYTDAILSNYSSRRMKNNIKVEDIAYLIYTSGSTGNPKGVAIQHKQYINAVFSWQCKYKLLEISVNLLQMASFGFDVFAGDIGRSLASGGKMVLCPDEIRLNLREVAKLIDIHKISLLESTPTLIIPLMEYLFENKGMSESLKLLIIGSDVCKFEDFRKIVERFGKKMRVLNSYGLTETAIDSSYFEGALEEMPEKGIVPVGKPMCNMKLYVFNKWMGLQPLGVTGEIFVGGESVGPGYINQKQLTNERYLDDPFEKGKKMYKTGDFGKWLANGNLLLLGRVDEQIKIRGNRIELGEIESKLRTHEKIKDAIVIVKEKDGSKFIAAYYVSREPVTAVQLRKFLSESLPDYMIPVYYVCLQHIPLTINGKLDKKALPEPKLSQAAEKEIKAPETLKEKLLLEIWSQVLKISNLSVNDNFFLLGGDSIKSIQIRSRVRSAGYDLSVKDIFTNQTIYELAQKLKEIKSVSDQLIVNGKASLTPIQKRYFEISGEDKTHYNQSVMLNFPGGIAGETVRKILEKLQEHHDALRMVFRREGNTMIQENCGIGESIYVEEQDWRNIENVNEAFLTECNKIQYGMNVDKGSRMRCGLFHLKDGSRLLIVISHLVIDGISWRILFEDIETLYNQAIRKEALLLPLKTDAFLFWSDHLLKYTNSQTYKNARQYWMSILHQGFDLIKRDTPEGINKIIFSKSESFTLSREETASLLAEVHTPFGTQINDVLLAAFIMSVNKIYRKKSLMIELETHGRDDIIQKINVSRTLGWFSAIYPVLLEIEGDNISSFIRQVKETLRRVPNNGLDYLIYRYMDPLFAADFTTPLQPVSINFNYLGQFDSDLKGNSYIVLPEAKGDEISPEKEAEYDWEILGQVINGQLSMNLVYSLNQYQRETIRNLMDLYKLCLQEMISFCIQHKEVKLSPSDLTFKELSLAQVDELQYRYNIEDVYPLSPMQEGMLFHLLLNPKSDQYFEQMTFQVKGCLSMALIETSMNDLIVRYDVLRTMFLHQIHDRPLQIVLKQGNIDFTYRDIKEECLHREKSEVVCSYQVPDRAQPFEPDKGVLMRLIVLQTDSDEYTFIWSHSHLIMDGWCMGIIMQEFKEIYRKRIDGHEIVNSPDVKYARYIDWLEKRDKELSALYWRNYLEGYEVIATLPQKQMLPSDDLPYVLKSEEFTINNELEKLLLKVTSEYGITLYTILQTAWGIVLAKYNNTNDVVLGSVVSGRPPEIEGIENTVGLFINTVPVRINYTTEDRIRDLLIKVQKGALSSEQHQYHPLHEIQSGSELGRGLLNHIMVFENYPVIDEILDSRGNDTSKQAAFNITDVEIFEKDNYDLSISIMPGKQIIVKFDFNSTIYDKKVIKRALGHFNEVLEKLASFTEMLVSTIEIITEKEKHQLLYEFNDTKTDYQHEDTFVNLFQNCVQQKPLNIAVIHNDEQLSYKQLNELSNRIANFLIERHLTKGQIIPLLLKRSTKLLAFMLGIQKAGLAFLAIDIRNPINRIEKILSDCKPPILIIESDFTRLISNGPESSLFFDNPFIIDSSFSLEEQFADYATDNLGTSPGCQDLAYCIYTSGSTGEPKGVLLHQQGMINHFKGLIDLLDLNANDCFAQTAECSFDIYVIQSLLLLITGGCTHIIDREYVLYSDKLLRLLEANNITIIELVPSIIRSILLTNDNHSMKNSIRWLISCGEKISPQLSMEWYQSYPEIPIVNAYGPAETSDDVTAYIIPVNLMESGITDIPIGKPLPNVHIYILSQELRLCPVGIQGEICIAGLAVGRGYWNNESETNRKFIENKYNYSNEEGYTLMYKTGDIGYWQEDGNIIFQGRNDMVVKVRGTRIETGEVEKALLSIRGMEEVIVLVRGAEQQLCAYFSNKEIQEITNIRFLLAQKIPDFMIPAYFIQLKEFPLTVNGKINKKALPDPEITSDSSYETPYNEIQEKLAMIWADVLKIKKDVIGIHRSFFELGGHSLKATLLANKIGNEFKIIIPLKELFDRHTIKKQAEFIETTKWLIRNRLSSELGDSYEYTV